MIGRLGLLCAGPVYMILLVFLIQCVVYKEVTALFELSVSESFSLSDFYLFINA